MAVTNFSPLLGLALPTTGDLSGTWGTTVNDAITGLIDSAVAGTTTLSADADVTLTTTNGASNQARAAVILWTASNGATTRNITAPAQSKAYIVINAGTGSIVIRGAGPTTGVTISSGSKSLVAWNGSDFVNVIGGLVSLTSGVTGTLPVVNGGTGQTSYVNGELLIGNTTGNTLTKATLTAGSGISITNSTGSITIASTAVATPIVENVTTISVNTTIAVGNNGFSVGPETINTGVTLTVGANQRYVVF
jgi:hypothetical protein